MTYQTKDDVGRYVEHIMVDDFVFSYSVDHAAKEVRIYEIAPI